MCEQKLRDWVYFEILDKVLRHSGNTKDSTILNGSVNVEVMYSDDAGYCTFSGQTDHDLRLTKDPAKVALKPMNKNPTRRSRNDHCQLNPFSRRVGLGHGVHHTRSNMHDTHLVTLFVSDAHTAGKRLLKSTSSASSVSYGCEAGLLEGVHENRM